MYMLRRNSLISDISELRLAARARAGGAVMPLGSTVVSVTKRSNFLRSVA